MKGVYVKMFVKKASTVSILRNIVLAVAVLMIASFITYLVINGIDNSERLKKSAAVRNKFMDLVEKLEFNGINDQIKEAFSDYTALFDRNSNIIITDDDGKVIYSLNHGYMPDTGVFTVVVSPVDDFYSNMAYIVNDKYEIIYAMELVENYNYAKLRENSRRNTNIESIFTESGDAEYNGNDEMSMEGVRGKLLDMKWRIKDFGRNLAGRTGLANAMNYAYIGSKGWNLYVVYNDNMLHEHNYYNVYNKDISAVLSEAFGIAAGVLLAILWLLLPIWVFLDARKRDFKAPLWGILVLVTNVVGLIIYLVVRPELSVCKQCKMKLSSKYVVCPYCGTQNRELCPNCSQVIEETWVACPYCGRPRQTDTLTARG